jgi:hypothetical protein
MPTQIQLRRGSYAQHQAFTGAVAEPTFDTSNQVLRIHDGSSAGGMELVMGNSIYKGTPVKVVTTTNVTLYGTQTIDGVSLSAGDRVLVASQTSSYQNGIYNVSTTTWARAFDSDKLYNLNQHQFIYVAGGSNYAQSIWRQTSAAPAIIGVDAITYELWMSVESRGLAQNTVAGLVTRTSKGTYTGRAVTVSGQGISVSNGDGVSGNPLVSLNSTPNNTASTIMARDSGGNFTAGSATLNGSLEVNTGTITTTSTTATLLNANATTVNAFGAATSISLGSAFGTLTINNANTVITGNLTVNGTTEYLNSTTVQIADKNIELGKVTTPTDATADGGGITLKGAVDKTILWDSANANWSSSEHWNIASGKSFKIATIPVLSATSVLTDASQSSISIGTSATAIGLGANTGTLTINNPTIVGSQTTQNLWNTVATTVNAFGAATTTNLVTGATASGNTKTVNLATGGLTGSTTNLNLGSTGGTLTINSPLITIAGGVMQFTNPTDSTLSSNGSVIFAGGIGVAKNIVCDGTFSIFGDISVNGGDILTNQTNVTVFNTTATTANIFGAVSTLNMGANTGTLILGNPTVVGTQTTQNLYNTVATTLNIGGSATAINLGNATAATVTVRPGTVVGVNTNQSLYDTVATTVNAFGAATTLTLGNATGATATIRPGTVLGSNSTQNLWNTVATTVNFAGAATTLSIGASSGTTTINNNAAIAGTLAVTGTSSHTGNSTFAGTLGVTGATTLSSTLSVSGVTTISNATSSINTSSGALVVTGGVGIGGTAYVGGDLNVTGNLNISGSATQISTTNLSISDPLIYMATGNSGNTSDIGIVGHFNPGTYQHTGFVRSAANNEWRLFSGVTTEPTTVIDFTSAVYDTLRLGTLYATGNLNVTGTSSYTGNATFSGTLGVTGATTLGSTLGVTGAATLSSTLAVSSNTTVGGTLGVTGAATLSSTLAVSSNTTVGGTLGVTGAAILSSTLGVTGAATLSSTLNVSGTTTLGVVNTGVAYHTSLTLGAALPIASGGTGATTAQAARTNLLPSQSAGQAGYVLTTNGTDVAWSYLGNAMVTSFNGRSNAVTLTSGDVTGALGFTPLSSTSGTAISAGYLTGKDAYTNGSDGWFRSNGNAGWYSATYSVGIYATQAGWVSTYNSAQMMANGFQIASDIRIKDNIVDSKYGLDTVLQLRSVEYDRKIDGKHDIGLIAQEVEEIIPEFVHTDPEGMKSVNYPQMVSVLIKAVQELKAEVDDLKQQLGK